MNMLSQTPRRGQSSPCSAFADLLPLLDSPGLDAEEDAAVRAHLGSCAACQAQHAAYHQMTLDARRSLSPAATVRRHQTEELLAGIIQEVPATPEASISSPSPLRHPVRLRRPVRPRSLIASLAPLAAVLVIVVVAVTVFANHPRPKGNTGNGASAPHGSWSELSAISMVSADEGWAAGYTGPCSTTKVSPTIASLDQCQATDPVLMHYYNGRWSSVALPYQGPLNTITMLSATDGWAGGDGILLHYDGHTWKKMLIPLSWKLDRLQMLSDTDGWALGSISSTQAGQPHDVILHYDGSTWTTQPLPASLGITQQHPIDLRGLEMISPTEGWVVGVLYVPGTLNTATPTPIETNQTAVILHYANGQWTLQSSTANAALESISMTSATDGWAVGSAGTNAPLNPSAPPTGEDSHAFLLHYTGGKWTEETPAALTNVWGSATSVSMDSASDGWAIGPAITETYKSPETTDLLHYNGQGWASVSALVFQQNQHKLVALTCLQMLSATDGWAVGFLQTGNGQSLSNGDGVILSLTAVIVHYHNNTWSIVPTS